MVTNLIDLNKKYKALRAMARQRYGEGDEVRLKSILMRLGRMQFKSHQQLRLRSLLPAFKSWEAKYGTTVPAPLYATPDTLPVWLNRKARREMMRAKVRARK